MSYKTSFKDGRLGIGLDVSVNSGAPKYPLDINGDIRLTGAILKGDETIYTSGSGMGTPGIVSNQTDGVFKIGINNITPTTALDVSGHGLITGDLQINGSLLDSTGNARVFSNWETQDPNGIFVLTVTPYNIGLKSSAGGTITGKTYSHSSTQGNGMHFENAFDGDFGNFGWIGSGSASDKYNNSSPYEYLGSQTTTNVDGTTTLSGSWGQIDIGQNSVITSFSMTFLHYYTGRRPSNFYLLGSLDGTNWTTIQHVQNPSWSSNHSGTWNLNEVKGLFRYYRISVLNLSGSSDSRVMISEIELFGALESQTYGGTSIDLYRNSSVTIGDTSADITNKLFVNGNTKIGGDLQLNGTLKDASGNPRIFSNWTINGDDLTRDSNITVTGDLQLNGTLKDSNGNPRIFSNWDVSGGDIYRESNVGIGTTNPQTQLHVSGTITSDGLKAGTFKDFSFSNETKITASDGGANNRFGNSVAINGNYVIVGAHYANKAYIYNLYTGAEIRTLTPSDGDTGQFGIGVAISGNYAIVGMRTGGSNGKAYIFNVQSGEELHIITHIASESSAYFGEYVAIDGNYAIVGASYEYHATTYRYGHAYIFNVTTGTQLHKLTASDASNRQFFGKSVAISGNYAIIGANSYDTNTNPGAAYIFDVQSGTQLHKLTDTNGANTDSFGISVAISGNYAIVGAYDDDDNHTDAGSAFIYNVQTGGLLYKLHASDDITNNYFGYNVGIDGNYAIVGCGYLYGASANPGAYIFDVQTGKEVKILKSSDMVSSDEFGYSVAISSNYAIIGSHKDDDNGQDSGSAYIFGPTEPSVPILSITDNENMVVNGNTYFAGSLNGPDMEKALYDFASHTFTNAGAEGPYGPTLSECKSEYSSASWTQNDSYFKMSHLQGYQEWTVPQNGIYRITAVGASSGSDAKGDDYTNGARGQGAMLRGDFSLEKGEIIRIVVGQRGQNNSNYNTCGGGGGSFVVKAPYNTNDSILVIAGGGGSAENPSSDAADNQHASAETSGLGSYNGSTTSSGGTGGNGGGGQPSGNTGGGGGGFFTDGFDSPTFGEGGKAFTNLTEGCWGGDKRLVFAESSYPNGPPYGGFGGGGGPYGAGGGTGGGGGYSGGGGSDNAANSRAGGGGSYNANAISGTASGESGLVRYQNGNTGWDHGYVIIESLTEGGMSLLLLNPDGGNVGIGTDSPQTQLHVNGTITSDSLKIGSFMDFTFSKETKITASDAAANDNFGQYVAIDGNYAIVGAPNNDDTTTNTGSAYIFNVVTGTQLHKLTASDPGASDYFGRCAISGNYAIVGAIYDDDNGSNSGSAYIFNVTTGTQLHKITASDAATIDYFGFSVAISGNYAIVGAKGDDAPSSDSGSAYIFNVATGTQLHKITASDGAANSGFGQSVAIDGNYAIVGASAADVDGTNSGRAYIFNVATGTQLHMLSSNDIASGDQFGFSVAISGNYAIVGAIYDDDYGTSSGSAYIFNVQTGAQLHKLVDTDGEANDDFGQSVAISGNYAIVGARQYRNGVSPNRGAVFMYDVISGTEIKKITASDAADDDYFSVSSLAISGNYIIVGARNDDDDGNNSGSAYIFGPNRPSGPMLSITDNGDINFASSLNGAILPGGGLYDFTSHTFTNAGKIGNNGPTQAECISAYSSATWTGNTDFFSVHPHGYQIWTVPITGKYTIVAKGASDAHQGTGATGGKGASIEITYRLNKGDKYWICVGQKGHEGSSAGGWWASGGGGGTFMVKNTTDDHSKATIHDVLVIAGGGGGSTAHGNILGSDATSITSSTDASTSGGVGSGNGGGGGGGFIGNGEGYNNSGGRSFINGLSGSNNNGYGGNFGIGGFGGGGTGGGNPGGGGGGLFGGNYGSSSAQYPIHNNNNVGADGGGSYYKTGGTEFSHGINDIGHGSLSITFIPGTTPNGSLLLNPNGGNVGIGTESPLNELDVNGTITCRGGLEGYKQSMDKLYDFTSHTFTRCGAIGRYGPSLSDCTTEYSSTTWASNTEYFNQTIDGMQDWTVPESGTYSITAVGAAGGDGGHGTSGGGNDIGGAGAHITRNFDLERGEVIRILVGQQGFGDPDYYHRPGGGGGGTFITRAPHNTLESIIIIAGGGGGGGQGSYGQTSNGQPDSYSHVGGANNGITSSSSGYSDGAGGKGSASNNYGGNGGGFWGDGHTSYSGEGITSGHSYVNSSEAGHGGIGWTHSTKSEGGFGGGAAGNLLPGGGGGFAGGKYEGSWSSSGTAYGGSSYVQGEGPLYTNSDSSIIDGRGHTYIHPSGGPHTVYRHGYVTIELIRKSKFYLRSPLMLCENGGNVEIGGNVGIGTDNPDDRGLCILDNQNNAQLIGDYYIGYNSNYQEPAALKIFQHLPLPSVSRTSDGGGNADPAINIITNFIGSGANSTTHEGGTIQWTNQSRDTPSGGAAHGQAYAAIYGGRHSGYTNYEGEMIFYTSDTTNRASGRNLNPRMVIRGQNVGIGYNTPSYRFCVNGSVYYTSGGLNGSDDRIKHNEQPITNALSIISKLKPKHYIKTGKKIYDPSHNFQLDTSGNPLDASGNPLEYMEDYTIETGIIAQEIKKIPELQFVVQGEETDDNPLGVDYNSIHCTHIAATLELDKKVENEIAEVKAKNSDLENKVATLETENQETKSKEATLEAENQELKNRLTKIEEYLGL